MSLLILGFFFQKVITCKRSTTTTIQADVLLMRWVIAFICPTAFMSIHAAITIHYSYGVIGIGLVEEGMCPIDHVWGTQTYPYNKACTQKFAIPTSYYMNVGLLPSCSGKSDGNYQFRTRPCDAYYRCEGGKAIAVKCPQHTYFDVIRRRCSSDVACYRAWWSTVDFLRELYFNSLYYFL